jgi:hypothetical protein
LYLFFEIRPPASWTWIMQYWMQKQRFSLSTAYLNYAVTRVFAPARFACQPRPGASIPPSLLTS